VFRDIFVFTRRHVSCIRWSRDTRRMSQEIDMNERGRGGCLLLLDTQAKGRGMDVHSKEKQKSQVSCADKGGMIICELLAV